MTGCAVEAYGLRKRYRGVTAVDGVDLRIDHGEVYALLGPNGAGKTTTVEVLEGYRRADGGTVRVLGADPATAPLAWRRDIGVVLQESRDLSELTVAERRRRRRWRTGWGCCGRAGSWQRGRRPRSAAAVRSPRRSSGPPWKRSTFGWWRRHDRHGNRDRWWRLALARGGVELKLFFRERSKGLPTFGVPVVLLLLLGSIFDAELDVGGVSGGMIYTASMAALAVCSASFIEIGVGVAIDRDDGTLARLRRVPAPAGVYLAGKVIQVLVTGLIGATLVLLAGVLRFGLVLPTDPVRWLTFGWVFLLGVTACSLLGVAVSGLAGSARAAGAVMNLPFLVMLFLSGIMVPIAVLPEAFRAVGAVFPFKWLAQGLRAALLPEQAAAYEAAGAWEHERIALVLVAWCIGGLLLCLKTFRWRSRRDG